MIYITPKSGKNQVEFVARSPWCQTMLLLACMHVFVTRKHS